MKQKIGISASALRLFAMGVMLMDHIGAVLFPGTVWLRIIGRLAFPIFAFQVAEGYRHTRNFNRYCLRLLIFALVSEIPFDLVFAGTVYYPFYQNVMFTLLLGLWAVRQTDRLINQTRKRLIHFLTLILTLLTALVISPDYGVLGVLSVVAFYLLRNTPGGRIGQLAVMFGIHVFGYISQSIPLPGGRMEFPLQGFAVFALIPIWLYTGEKGRGGKILQFAGYAFYPVHLLILYGISRLFCA